MSTQTNDSREPCDYPSDPILARMSPYDRAKWHRLSASGYAALKEAHEIYVAASRVGSVPRVTRG